MTCVYLISLEFVDKFELTSISLWKKGVLFIYSSLNQLMSLFPVRLLFATEIPSKPKCVATNHTRPFSPYIGRMCLCREQRKEIQAEGAALQTNG